jgi:hypothetical protein
MKNDFVKSSTHFLPSIKRAMLLFAALLAGLALLFPAPLQVAADRALTPNPAKSAWFLLWIQELVSWSNQMIWTVLLLAALLFLLPWLPGQVRAHQAGWFPAGSRRIWLPALAVSAALLLLTVIAMFLRGANWALLF